MIRICCVVLVAMMVAAPAAAQDVNSGSLTGTVRDSSGGALPGVTVEASSPALIERAKSVVTDDEGRYRLIDLRPGAYTVTFTLQGFSTLKRDGIEVTTGFAATVNAELAVGSVTETVTVTGAAPLVDVSNSSQQVVLTREVIQALPLAKNSGAWAAILPGSTQTATNIDVGGTKNEQASNFSIHGGGGMQQLRDGMLVTANQGSASPSPGAVAETQIQLTGGLTAEAVGAGVQVNYIPREGGNQFRGTAAVDFGGDALQSTNLDTDLRNRGLTAATSIRKLYDVSGGYGGPIVRDRLWFYTSARRLVQSSYQPGNYYNRADLVSTLFYVPDTSRPVYDLNFIKNSETRVTAQPTAKDRIAGTYRLDSSCFCFDQIASGLRAPDGTTAIKTYPLHVGQFWWTRTATSRLLFEGRFGYTDGFVTNNPAAGTSPTAIPVLDQSRNYRYNAPQYSIVTSALSTWDYMSMQGYGSVSYVTGSHNLKFGTQLRKQGNAYGIKDSGSGISYVFNGSAPGVARPVSVNYFVVPYADQGYFQNHALYAQDQWRVDRFTVNLGLRFEYFTTYMPEQNQPAGPFVPARTFAAVDNAASLKDLNPRVGLAWDLFGTGRTAIKASTGRFVEAQTTRDLMTALNPLQRLSTTASRSWADNGDFIPQENELGPFSNSNFGNLGAVTVNYDPKVIRGWGHLPYSWQSSLALSHELIQGVAVNIGYYRTVNGNQTVTQNVLRGVNDYDYFCLNAPTHASLPGGGGYQICGIHDVVPAKASAVQNVVRLASDFGGQSSTYDGVDLTMNARFARGMFVTGGLSISKVKTDACDVQAAVPNLAVAPTACASDRPLSAGTDFKIAAGHQLPWAFNVSMNYQNIPGIATTASWVVPNSVIAPALGRNLSACRAGQTATECTATLTIPLVANNALYLEDRIQLLNFAVSRDFTLNSVRFRPRFQLDNSLNANPVISVNNSFGASWQRPTGVLTPRTAKIALQVDF